MAVGDVNPDTIHAEVQRRHAVLAIDPHLAEGRDATVEIVPDQLTAPERWVLLTLLERGCLTRERLVETAPDRFQGLTRDALSHLEAGGAVCGVRPKTKEDLEVGLALRERGRELAQGLARARDWQVTPPPLPAEKWRMPYAVAILTMNDYYLQLRDLVGGRHVPWTWDVNGRAAAVAEIQDVRVLVVVTRHGDSGQTRERMALAVRQAEQEGAVLVVICTDESTVVKAREAVRIITGNLVVFTAFGRLLLPPDRSGTAFLDRQVGTMEQGLRLAPLERLRRSLDKSPSAALTEWVWDYAHVRARAQWDGANILVQSGQRLDGQVDEAALRDAAEQALAEQATLVAVAATEEGIPEVARVLGAFAPGAPSATITSAKRALLPPEDPGALLYFEHGVDVTGELEGPVWLESLAGE